MDYQNRSERCIWSYQSSSFWPIYSTTRIYKKNLWLPYCMLGHLRYQGIRVRAYMNDRIIRTDCPEIASSQGQQTTNILQSLGWAANWQKSLPSPSQAEFLGPYFNLQTSLILPPNRSELPLSSMISSLSQGSSLEETSSESLLKQRHKLAYRENK